MTTKLTEKRMLSSVRLTNNQKKVLTKIIAAPTPKVAADEISTGRGMLAARDLLIKLGLLTFNRDEDTAEVTDDGMDILKDLNLVDDMGELTDDGEDIAYDTGEEKPEEQKGEENQPMGLQMGESLLQHINKLSHLTEARQPIVLNTQEKKLLRQFALGDDDVDWSDLPNKVQDALIDVYQEDIPYGTLTGDTGTTDQWLFDHFSDTFMQAYSHVLRDAGNMNKDAAKLKAEAAGRAAVLDELDRHF